MYVMHYASCSVVVVPGTSGFGGPFHRVVVGVDASLPARHALGFEPRAIQGFRENTQWTSSFYRAFSSR